MSILNNCDLDLWRNGLKHTIHSEFSTCTYYTPSVVSIWWTKLK